MVQAARSGRQNIAEGSRAAATTSQTEPRLGVGPRQRGRVCVHVPWGRGIVGARFSDLAGLGEDFTRVEAVSRRRRGKSGQIIISESPFNKSIWNFAT
jgi:hypothetical protein